jgi:hypothetical protein
VVECDAAAEQPAALCTCAIGVHYCLCGFVALLDGRWRGTDTVYDSWLQSECHALVQLCSCRLQDVVFHASCGTFMGWYLPTLAVRGLSGDCITLPGNSFAAYTVALQVYAFLAKSCTFDAPCHSFHVSGQRHP